MRFVRWLIVALIVALVGMQEGCASAAQVTLNWTWPRVHAADSLSCLDAPGDTLTTLTRGELWSRYEGQGDSTLVSTITAVGQEGRPGSAVVQQRSNTRRYYWLYSFCMTPAGEKKSCQSNMAVKTTIRPPGGMNLN